MAFPWCDYAHALSRQSYQTIVGHNNCIQTNATCEALVAVTVPVVVVVVVVAVEVAVAFAVAVAVAVAVVVVVVAVAVAVTGCVAVKIYCILQLSYDRPCKIYHTYRLCVQTFSYFDKKLIFDILLQKFIFLIYNYKISILYDFE